MNNAVLWLPWRLAITASLLNGRSALRKIPSECLVGSALPADMGAVTRTNLKTNTALRSSFSALRTAYPVSVGFHDLAYYSVFLGQQIS